MTSLHIAAQRGDLEVVDWLLRSGAAINQPTQKETGDLPNGFPLDYAIFGGNTNTISGLIYAGAIAHYTPRSNDLTQISHSKSLIIDFEAITPESLNEFLSRNTSLNKLIVTFTDSFEIEQLLVSLNNYLFH